MHGVTVTLQLVTLLFLGGADPEGEPELRAPSLRGARRYWVRALLGGVLGAQPDALFRWESPVFGSTDYASPLAVHVSGSGPGFVAYSHLAGNREGIAYLFFGARKPDRRAITADYQFNCAIRPRAGTEDLRALRAAAASLWLLTHLGGLGMRAQRGGGNLQVLSIDWSDPSLPPLITQARTA
jgi:CRISPR-associated protein Cmr1